MLTNGNPSPRRAGWRRLVLPALLTALCTLNGCALLGMKGERVNWRETTLIATADVNHNSPLAVDVVMISDQATLDKLIALQASQWFAQRDDLAATYPTTLRYRSWEVVPGETLNIDRRTFAGPRVAGVLVFANYAAPGAHRQRIDTFKGRLVITMKTDGYTLETLP
ncbi:hypothetical protein [Robbsia sp. KACC 23696]|uniref:hypothetical protein n=1 Tax=Robbsia sp. KACC 23696 TaxID=3149231 RepID=UPI00325B4E37